MQPEQMILPTIATLALGTALLVPLRDDRLGKRATMGGGSNVPLRPNFGAILGTPSEAVPIEPETSPDASTVAEPSDAIVESSDAELEIDAVRKPARPDFRVAFETFGTRIRDFFAAPPKSDPSPETFASDEASESNAGDATPEEHVVERSFADTLGALLPLREAEPAAVDVPNTHVAPAPLTMPSAQAAGIPSPAARPEPPPLVIAAEDVRKNVPAPAFDRVVPLTRMPLRPKVRDITWPALVPDASVLATEADRHAYLRAATRTADAALEPLLLAAYREENAPGRLLAMRALRSGTCAGAGAVFEDALHVGTDDERSFAVDALLALGRREAVTSAFNDRVDAIAAQAALGYVGTSARADYVTELSQFVDRSRVDAILALLAGFVE